MRSWKLLVAVGVAAVGFSSRADAQVSVSVPGVGSVTVGGGSTYYSPYSYGQTYYTPSYGSYVVPAGYTTDAYTYPTTSSYYSGATYAYPMTYGTTYSYPMTYSSGYTYPTYGTSSYYPGYSSRYYNPGWGWGGYNYARGYNNFGQGIVAGAVGAPAWTYPMWGGGGVRGAVRGYAGYRLGQALFD